MDRVSNESSSHHTFHPVNKEFQANHIKIWGTSPFHFIRTLALNSEPGILASSFFLTNDSSSDYMAEYAL